ncbi:hypothetical protein F8R89_01060 [Streptomyces sp. SS1-1]|nr:hypothetical protein F8R89_01060 [Streptomyces sp. SS1-1]
MPDDLYQRYQAAARAHQEHTTSCPRCTGTARCSEGARLWSVFERLQDAYIDRQRTKRTR